MIPELGHYSLILALCLAIIQAVIPLWLTLTNKTYHLALAKSIAYGQVLFIGLSMVILVYSLLICDFTVAYVAQNANTHLPALYRLCATWGAHEGSLLLWVFILSVWTALLARISSTIPPMLKSRILSVLSMISVGFLLFLLSTSNPFARLLPEHPLQGQDLNPLLQDPGLAIHPPMLYIGYVGFAIPFAFAIAALISGKFDAKWARLARPWTLMAWSFLTLGITLGSWWAYRVLGWGGWWFWDPVENASFLPWLSGTALLHSLIVAEKRDAFKAWTVLLAVITFALSLMGTFLVRSGVLVSVHAFALDPARGEFMLYFLGIVVGGSLSLYLWQGHKIKNSGIFQLWSRESLLLTNNVILTSCMLTVLLGTLYPLIIDVLGLGKLSVGSPYFNAVFVPLTLPLLFLMGIGPAIHWKKGEIALVVKRLKYSLPLCVLLACLLPWISGQKPSLWIIVCLLLIFWVMIATVQNALSPRTSQLPKQRLGMATAHWGVGICALGILLTSTYSQERDVIMRPNDKLMIGPYQVTFKQVSTRTGPNYSAYQGHFKIDKNRHTFVLEPELRIYQAQKMAVAKAAIRATPSHDLYIALGEAMSQGAWSLRIYHKPFIRWIWLGSLLMMVGGCISAYQLRKNQSKMKRL